MAEHDLRSVAFPKLDESQMAALDRCPLTKLPRYRDGEKHFKVGDRDFKFYVIKSGKVEIVDESGESPKTIAVQGPGEFTGDVAQLDARAVQLHRCDSAVRLDTHRERAGRQGLRPDGPVRGPVPPLDRQAAAVPAGDQPPRRRAGRLDQAHRLGRRRRSDDGPVRARVLESNVN